MKNPHTHDDALAHKNLQLEKNGFHEHIAYDFETENAKYQKTVTPNYQQIVREK